MKKFFLILVTVIGLGFSVNAQNVVLRGTHKLCGGGAELTLNSNGTYIFWHGGNRHTLIARISLFTLFME
jgi:hypothetical protein